MERIIQKLVHMCGYHISRLPQGPKNNAFTAMQRLLAGTENPIIFDVGAHSGYVSKTFRDLFPTAEIYAFEPFEESFEILKENSASDPGIHVFNFGLSDRDGPQAFHSNLDSGTNSLLSTHESGAQTWRAGLFDTQKIIQAQFKTIDSVVAEMDIQKIDILKLDVQGAEHRVITGAADACKRGMIRLIYSEIITQPTYNDQKRFDEALAPFYNNSFDLYNMYNLNTTSEGRLRQIDAIFTKTVG